MTAPRSALLAALMFAAAPPARAEPPALRVYGPGGPLTPVRGCAERFARARGVKVVVDGGPEERWVEQAAQDGDVVFSSAEHVLSDLMRRRPGLLDPATRVSLYERRAAILVRKGNPRKIRSLKDLARKDVKLVDVNGAGQVGLWEDLAGRHGLIPELQRNIALSVSNTAEAIAAWRDRPELDAWITFASWHDRLRDEADLVEFPQSERLYRGTPAVLLSRTEQRALALAFLEFLRSEECHAVFRAAGWR
ncbi:MAG TPA: substrate-binding domain-containing protein [Anaeromyxobacteraceae bacterium]|nr:substrate-binding domain-containing protein [Anaeromyxobacteraceae bacterium]